MAFQRWTLYDPTTDTTFVFPVNPKEGGEPSFEKTITTQSTCAPAGEGRTILAEGRDRVGEISWSGYFRSTTERNNMLTWARKRTQLKRTNDLGEQDWIYIDKLTPKRKHVVNRPYRADYDAHAFVLDIPA